MDTSEQYIKMCEKASGDLKPFMHCEEDSAMRRQGGVFASKRLRKIICPKCGDVGFGVYCRDCGSKTKRVMERDIYIDYNQLDEKSVWLPTQSQLQEMLGGSWIETFEEFGWFVNDNSCDEWSFDNKLNYGSMEQLWLAFVMKSCYNKEWVNGQWEKIDE